MKTFFYSLLTESEQNISVGSTSILLVILSWVFQCIWFTIFPHALLISPESLAILVGALYGLKKIPSAVTKVTEVIKGTNG